MAVTIFIFFLIYKSYHIAVILIYGYPANLLLLCLILIYLLIKKYHKLQIYFPQIKNNLIVIILSFLAVSIIAPFIILYSNKFSYNSVLSFELFMIEYRDKIVNMTNLDYSTLIIIFFVLLFLSLIFNKSLSIYYEKFQLYVSYFILILFSITSFSLTSYYFIDQKAKEIYSDTTENIKNINSEINNKKKFILTCNILKNTFENYTFQKKIIKNIITPESIKNSKELTTNFSYYLASYFNNHYNEKINKNIELSKNPTLEKIKKALIDYENKTYQLLILQKEQSIIRKNTVNLLTNILTKVININQNNLLKVFVNNLINDLNNQISYLVVERINYKNNIFKYIRKDNYLNYLKKYNKNIINLQKNYKFNFELYKLPKIKIKNRLRWFKYLRL